MKGRRLGFIFVGGLYLERSREGNYKMKIGV
jgi:hypothetical protein